ncbi:MAG: hypothetical protein ACYC9Q_14995 [Bacillota bacterium]
MREPKPRPQIDLHAPRIIVKSSTSASATDRELARGAAFVAGAGSVAMAIWIAARLVDGALPAPGLAFLIGVVLFASGLATAVRAVWER